MARPDFTLTWGIDRPGGIAAITPDNYKLGWQFRAGVPPLTVNFDYYQNLNDQRTIWLSEQFPVSGVTPFMRDAVFTAVDSAAARSALQTGNASNLDGGQLDPNLLAPSGVGAGGYGNSTNVGTFTVDSKGRVVNAANVPIAFPAVPSASEGQAGTAFEASQAEVDARAGAGKYMTPVKAGYGFSLTTGSNGGFQFPFWLGGWSIRWGEQNVGGNSNITIYTFAVSLWQMYTCAGQDGGDYQPLKAVRLGNSIRISNSDSNTQLARFFAVGRN